MLDQQLAPVEDQPDSLKVIEILNCAGLLHDIGNPPFGHFGESAIRNWFEKNLSLLQYKNKPLHCLLYKPTMAVELLKQQIRKFLKLNSRKGD